MINVKILSNGLTVILDTIPDASYAMIGIACKAGSINENQDEHGISHFIEHMLFKGSKNRSAFDIVKEIDELGASINAGTGYDATIYYVKCLSENLISALDILTDMIENPLFDPAAIENERRVIIEEINMYADDPESVSIDRLSEIVFNNSQYSHYISGKIEDVKSITPEQIRKYYKEHYTVSNLVVSIAGLFDEDEVLNFLDSRFKNLAHEPRQDKLLPVKYEPRRETIIKDTKQSHIDMGIPSYTALDEERYKIKLISYILGGGMTSRLFQNLRESKGLCYSISSTLYIYTYAGYFVISSGVPIDRTEEAIDAISQELKRLKDEPIGLDELDRAKIQYKSMLIYDSETVKSHMMYNISSYIKFNKIIDTNDTIRKISDINIDEIECIKTELTNFSNYSLVNVTGKHD